MKKLLYAGFCLALLMGLGCAITDYPIITDWYTGETIATNGKALIMSTGQVATTYPDGGSDCSFSMIDQKATGEGTLTSYNHFTTDGSMFLDHLYCSPDWTGCSMVTASNGGEPFDFTANWNCKGIRSLYYVLSVGVRYGECGNASLEANNVMNALDVVNSNTLAGVINRNTTQAYLTSNGFSTAVNIYGSYPFTYNLQQERFTIDMSTPLYNAQRRVMTNWRDNYQAGSTNLDIYYKGVQISRTMFFM